MANSEVRAGEVHAGEAMTTKPNDAKPSERYLQLIGYGQDVRLSRDDAFREVVLTCLDEQRAAGQGERIEELSSALAEANARAGILENEREYFYSSLDELLPVVEKEIRHHGFSARNALLTLRAIIDTSRAASAKPPAPSQPPQNTQPGQRLYPNGPDIALQNPPGYTCWKCGAKPKPQTVLDPSQPQFVRPVERTRADVAHWALCRHDMLRKDCPECGHAEATGSAPLTGQPVQPVEGVSVGGERAIVVGSTWKQSVPPGIRVDVLSTVRGVQYQWRGENGYDDVSEKEFRMHFAHVSDPTATPEPVSEA